MLRQMLVHAVLAALVMGSAAAVYSQAAAGAKPETAIVDAGNGYIQPSPTKDRQEDDDD